MLTNDVGQAMTRNLAAGLAAGAASGLVRGGSFQNNLPGILRDVVASTIGNSIADQMTAASTQKIYGYDDANTQIGPDFRLAGSSSGSGALGYSGGYTPSDQRAAGYPGAARFVVTPRDKDGYELQGGGGSGQTNTGVSSTPIDLHNYASQGTTIDWQGNQVAYAASKDPASKFWEINGNDGSFIAQTITPPNDVNSSIVPPAGFYYQQGPTDEMPQLRTLPSQVGMSDLPSIQWLKNIIQTNQSGASFRAVNSSFEAQRKYEANRFFGTIDALESNPLAAPPYLLGKISGANSDTLAGLAFVGAVGGDALVALGGARSNAATARATYGANNISNASVGELALEAAAARPLNTTRSGVTRTNAADWRSLRDHWSDLGYGEILSEANLSAIAKGRTPKVDNAWVSVFPEDGGLMGEKISMHHIGSTPLTVPLAATRHLNAHMPGGFRYNVGGPGSALPFYPPKP
jgi:hypothetical protein